MRGRAIYRQSGINWVHFIEVDWQGAGRGEVTILREWRVHATDAMPESIGTYEIIEDGERTACAIILAPGGRNGLAIAIKNREHVSKYST